MLMMWLCVREWQQGAVGKRVPRADMRIAAVYLQNVTKIQWGKGRGTHVISCGGDDGAAAARR